MSGGLYTVATRLQPRGALLAFGVFGGIAFVGFLASLGIQSANLEAEGGSESGSGSGSERSASSSEDEEERTLLG